MPILYKIIALIISIISGLMPRVNILFIQKTLSFYLFPLVRYYKSELIQNHGIIVFNFVIF